MAQSPWTPLHAQVHQTLRSRQLLPNEQAMLIAVSGGQDSLCLAQLLIDLQPKWNWQLGIVHADHRWRTDSAANAAHVAQLAANWKLPFYQCIANPPPGSEAAARQWRYQQFAELATEQGYSRLVTGHTASDRAETLLYNLMRGSGADGLQALAWQRPLMAGLDCQVVRPLLEVTRSQTGQFCQKRRLPIWHDTTNQDPRYARNRIRLDLLPYLASFNPRVEATLAQTAELLQAEVDYLDAQTQALWQQAVQMQHYQPWLYRPALQTAPLALQRRVVRQTLQQVMGSSPNFDQVEKVVALIHAPHRAQTDPLPGGAIAQVNRDWIQFQPS
jgi:tRNA(Ile)-lysidine synthase